MTSWERFQSDWKGKRVLIMGLGLQGRGVGDAKVFAEAGAKVTVTDLKSEDELAESLKKLVGHQIRFVLGKHDAEDFKVADVIIRNPAVPRESPYLKVAREHGVPIKMDSSLFALYCPLPIIGITGTRGKTTTTMMIYEVLKKGRTLQGRTLQGPTFLGGNVPGSATLELLKEMAPAVRSPLPWSPSTRRGVATAGFGRTSGFSDENPGPSEEGVVVLELSSWELEGWEEEKISPHIAVFTNFSEDHLNRYASMEEYFLGKLPITSHQSPSDWFIVHRQDEWAERAAKISNAQIRWFSSSDLPKDVHLSVPGDHNRANAAAALAVADIIGVSRDAALSTLQEFRGVPGRLETIATIDGVTYINDTTATTPTATIAALRAIKQPTILICGGSSKKLNVHPLVEEIVKKVKHVVFLKGDGTEEMLSEIASLQPKADGPLAQDSPAIDRFDNLQKAVDRARRLAHPGDVVLLSPGFASFSMFVNEFDRGQQFNDTVLSWQKRR